MDSANILLTVVLSLIALVAVLLRGVKLVLHNWAVEEGLIRPRRRGEASANWPNEWHSLPDALEDIHQEMRKHHSKDSH